MVSCLPLGNNAIQIQRGLTTSSTAIFVPFTTQELFQTSREALYPPFPAPRLTERVYEDPALWIVGKPEQNEKTVALQEVNQHTDPAKGKASGSTDDPETDWP